MFMYLMTLRISAYVRIHIKETTYLLTYLRCMHGGNNMHAKYAFHVQNVIEGNGKQSKGRGRNVIHKHFLASEASSEDCLIVIDN